jgi:hypothetical protein
MSEKTIVRRSVVIVLAISVASLVGTTVYLVSTVNQKDSVIADLNDTVNLRKYAVWVNNETVSQTAGSYTSWKFTANVTGYVFVSIWSSTTKATYVRVIYNATIPALSEESDWHTNYTWVLVPEGAWYYYQYDNQVNTGNDSHAIFPVFPWLSTLTVFGSNGPTIVEVRVGNTNTFENATEQVTIVYYY